MEKTSEELYQEREKRITDTIQQTKADRVPVMLELSYLPAKYTGITCEAGYYNYDLWLESYLKAVRYFEPDMVQTSPFFPGKFYEILDNKQIKLPGHGSDPNHPQQFVEGEYIKADEYDYLMQDPTNFLYRRYFPRLFGSLEPFSKLPTFSQTAFSYMGASAIAELMVSPEVAPALEKFLEAGREITKWRSKMNSFNEEIVKLGIPLYGTSGEHIPFDHLSYHVRGMNGIIMDMYRKPEKLMEVLDWLLPVQIERALNKARAGKRKRIYFALHRGADVFMSPKQFEKFYWPHAKKMIQALLDEGFTPCLFLEGDYTSRLEYFLELPKAKILARIDASDINKVKKVLQGHICIMGNVPVTLLQMGSTKEVEEYCKNLIDLLGPDGGFIMTTRSAPDDVNPENLKTLVDVTKKYGVYK